MRTDGSGPQGLFTKSLATDSTQADFNLPHLWGRCPKSEHPAQDVQVWSKLALILHIKAPSLCDQTEGALAKGAQTVLCLSLQPLRGHPPTADAVPPDRLRDESVSLDFRSLRSLQIQFAYFSL